METETQGAPFTGAPMFHVSISAIVPPEVSISVLRDDLLRVAEKHDLDITLKPIVPGTDE
jgi:glycine cleavage system regulatory protein